MQTFDVLDPKLDIFGTKVLEASAGTGKTFAIEHLVVRLLIEAQADQRPLELEQILAITFTRAAARELRMRIRANIEKALFQIQTESLWPYLKTHEHSPESIRRLKQALFDFDRAAIDTIHGFCQKMLTQFSLQSGVYIHRLVSEGQSQEIQAQFCQFLETDHLLYPEQLGRVLEKFKDVSSLYRALDRSPFQEKDSEDFSLFRIAIHSAPSSLSSLHEEFQRARSNYKMTGFQKVNFEEQIDCLRKLYSNPDDEVAFRKLLFWRGTLFFFLAESNRKVRFQGEDSSPLIQWCVQALGPIVSRAIDPKVLLGRLKKAWDAQLTGWLKEKGQITPNFLLEQMSEVARDPTFLEHVQEQFQAVIIDEFQDTDQKQWQIFRRLFLEKQKICYLVGDPKQSIYRFRNADLYTYFSAREQLGESSWHSLDTNFRSTSALVTALNTFFGEDYSDSWLFLPRENQKIPYRKVNVGSTEKCIADEKGALQFFAVKNIGEPAFCYVAQEITRLRQMGFRWSSFAILVKDRYHAREVQRFLRDLFFPCCMLNRSSIGQTKAFRALEEVFQAIFHPQDQRFRKIFLSGPFASFSIEELCDRQLSLPFLLEWKVILEKEGLPGFFRSFFTTIIHGESILEKMQKQDEEFFSDTFHLVEYFLESQPKGREAILRLFRQFEIADPEDDKAARRGIASGSDFIQIMTIHASKGLEFDVVFALGVSATTPRGDEDVFENQAEKLRQLYVALTRARLRVYVPIVCHERVYEGAEAPIDLFWRYSKLGKQPQEIIQKLISARPIIGFEEPLPSALIPIAETNNESPLEQSASPIFFRKCAIYSYSSLSQAERPLETTHLQEVASGQTLFSLPRGSETGVIIHRILERVFSEKTVVHQIVLEELMLTELEEWKDAILQLVENVLSFSLFPGFTLKDCQKKQVELEFFLQDQPHFLKGFIDFVFLYQNRLYFVDWKTNDLGINDEAYSIEKMQKAMDEHDYWFQASLYAKALQQAWPEMECGGAFYLFLRGILTPTRGALFFQPSPYEAREIWK